MKKLGFIFLTIAFLGCQSDENNDWEIRINGSVLSMEQTPQKNIPIEAYTAEKYSYPYAFIIAPLSFLDLETLGKAESNTEGRFEIVSNIEVGSRGIYVLINGEESTNYDSTKATLEIHSIESLYSHEKPIERSTYELKDISMENVVEYTVNFHRTQNITDTLYYSHVHLGTKKLVVLQSNSSQRMAVPSYSLKITPDESDINITSRMLQADTLNIYYRLGNEEPFTSLKIVATKPNDSYNIEF